MNHYNDEKWIGKKFGMLTVMGAEHVNKNGSNEWWWKVKCDCGDVKLMKPGRIIKGMTVSCGCWRERGMQVPVRHGESHTRLHNIWMGMIDRCNPDNAGTERYGKRGIRVCKEWEVYEAFRDWSLSHGYNDNLTIERKDVNEGYCPENCEWIPFERQARNRRTTFWVTYGGTRMSLAEAAERAGLPYKQVHYRIKRSGWTVEKALSEPLKKESDLHKRCEELGLNYHTIYNRVRMGWSEERALSTPVLGIGANQTTYK